MTRKTGGRTFALVWPPSSDPVFPPLSSANLGACLKSAGFGYYALDLNNALYKEVVAAAPRFSTGWEKAPDIKAFLALELFGDDATVDSRRGSRRLEPGAAGAVRNAFESAARLISSECYALGVTVTEAGLLGAALISGMVKKLDGRIPVIWGGPLLTPEVASGLLKAFPQVDAVCWGEGEETVVEIARRLTSGSTLGGVRGLAYRENGGIRLPGDRARHPDFRGLPPPDYSWIVPGMYERPYILLQVNRGCAWGRCNFCAERAVYPRYRTRDPAAVTCGIADVFDRIDMGLVQFGDAMLNPDPGSLLRFCERMREAGGRWAGGIRASGFSPELARAMASSGCVEVMIGTESFSDRTLSLMNKNATAGDNLTAIEAALEAGMFVTCTVMFGFPGEAARDLEQTLAALSERVLLYPDVTVDTTWFTPILGSPVHRDPSRFGIEIMDYGHIHRFLPESVAREVLPGEPFWSSLNDRPDYREVQDRIIAAMESGRAR